MSIVSRAEVVETKAVTIRLPLPVYERLERYTAFVRRDRSEVVTALVEYALAHDKEFAASEGIAPVRRRRAREET